MTQADSFLFIVVPAGVASLILSVIGVRNGKYGLVLLGAFLLIPFSYFMRTSTINQFGILLPFFQAGSAWAVHRQNRTAAWLLLLPAFIVSALLIIFLVGYSLLPGGVY